MSHHVTIYGALWATSKENNVINPVNGTVSQNNLPGVVRISCVVEPIFRRLSPNHVYLRSDSVRSSSRSQTAFHADPISVGERMQSQIRIRCREYGAISRLIFHSSFCLRNSLLSSVYLTVLYTCCSYKYKLKCVHGHHIRRHTELDDT